MITEAKPGRDKAYRNQAKNFANSLERWLGRYGEKELVPSSGGNYALDAGWVIRDYRGLIIYLNDGSYAKDPSFGTYKGHPMITLPILKKGGDLSHLDTRFSGMKSTFLHEFIHYLDNVRYKGDRDKKVKSADSSEVGDWKGYINNASEFNAFFQAGAYELERGVKVLKKSKIPEAKLVKIFPKNIKDFIKPDSLKRHWEPIYISNLQGKWQRKFLSRVVPLYKWYMEELYGK